MNICKQFARWIGFLVSLLFPKKLSESFRLFFVYFSSGYYGRFFKYFGKGTTIVSPRQLLGCEYISIGDNTHIEKNMALSAISKYHGSIYKPEIHIGKNCAIGVDNHITAIGKIVIGDNLLTGKNVLISDNSHGNTTIPELNIPPSSRDLFAKGNVTIGNNVWIGDNVVILSGVTIGDGSVIGANSVVTKSLPPYSIAVGAPAKRINDGK